MVEQKNEKKDEKNSEKELELLKLKARVYDLLAMRQQIENELKAISERINGNRN